MIPRRDWVGLMRWSAFHRAALYKFVKCLMSYWSSLVSTQQEFRIRRFSQVCRLVRLTKVSAPCDMKGAVEHNSGSNRAYFMISHMSSAFRRNMCQVYSSSCSITLWKREWRHYQGMKYSPMLPRYLRVRSRACSSYFHDTLAV